MSATHILNLKGGMVCGRDKIRGFIDLKTYRQLAASSSIPKRTASNVTHSCSKRPCGCPRRKWEKPAVCADCRRRADGGWAPELTEGG